MIKTTIEPTAVDQIALRMDVETCISLPAKSSGHSLKKNKTPDGRDLGMSCFRK